MKKILCLALIFIMTINYGLFVNANTVDRNRKEFLEQSEEMDISVNFESETFKIKGYLNESGWFIDIENFFKGMGCEYIIKNYTDYMLPAMDISGYYYITDHTKRYTDKRDFMKKADYFAEIKKDDQKYFLSRISLNAVSNYVVSHGVQYKNWVAEKEVNGTKAPIYISSFGDGWYISILGRKYVDIYSIAYILEDMGYITSVDTTSKEINVKGSDHSYLVEKIAEKYDLHIPVEEVPLFMFRGAADNIQFNETLYHGFDKRNKIFSPITPQNSKDICETLFKITWGIESGEIYVNYDEELDVYIAGVNGEYTIGKMHPYINIDVPDMLIVVRAFDGRVIYPDYIYKLAQE